MSTQSLRRIIFRLGSIGNGLTKLVSEKIGQQLDEYLVSHFKRNINQVVILYTESETPYDPFPYETVRNQVDEMFPRLKKMKMITVVQDLGCRQ